MAADNKPKAALPPRVFTSIRTGDGMRRAAVIHALMRAVEAEARAFADAHPAGLCRCPLCRTAGSADLGRDVAGIGWACGLTGGVVANLFPVAEVDADDIRTAVRDLVDRELDGDG